MLPAIVLALLTVVASADADSVVNHMLEGRTVEIPGFNIPNSKVVVKSIVLEDMKIDSLNITQSVSPSGTWGTVDLELYGGVTANAKVKVPILGTLDAKVQLPAFGPISVKANLSNPNATLRAGDAVQVDVTELDINLGEIKCNIATCKADIKEALLWFNNHKKTILADLSGTLTQYLVEIAANASMIPVLNPWHEAAVHELPFVNDTNLFNYSNSSAMNLATFVVRDVYGAADPATGNTALGDLIENKTLGIPLPLDAVVYQSKEANVTLTGASLSRVEIPMVTFVAVGERSFMFAVRFSNISAGAAANVSLSNPEASPPYAYAAAAAAAVSGVELSFNVSVLLAANATQYSTLPFVSLGGLDEFSGALAAAVRAHGASAQSGGQSVARTLQAAVESAFACWYQYPVDELRVSTLSVELGRYTVSDFILSEATSAVVANVANSIGEFFPNAMNAVIREGLHTVQHDANQLIGSIHHYTGDNPCAVNDSDPHTMPPGYHFNFTDSRVISVTDWVLNTFIGTTGSWSVNGYINASLPYLNFHSKTYSANDPDKFGSLFAEISDPRLAGWPFVTGMELLVPNGTATLHNAVDFGRIEGSVGVFFSVGGSIQEPFSNNFTFGFGFDALTAAIDVLAVLNPTRLLWRPIGDLGRAGCLEGDFDTLQFPLAEAVVKQLFLTVDCHDCQSPLFNELNATLNSQQGGMQVNEGVQILLDQVNRVVNEPSFQKHMTDVLSRSRDQCDTGVAPPPRFHSNTKDGPMTNGKAYGIVFGFVGTLALILAVYTPIAIKRAADRARAEGNVPYCKSSDLPLILHPSIPARVRWGVLVFLFGTVAMFLTSNTPPQGVGAEVHAIVNLGGSLIRIDNLFTYALANTIRDMWNGGVYVIAMLICILSGIWPYSKMVLLVWAWVTPPSVLKPAHRGSLLQVLDFFGKWSLLDSFMTVMLMCAFRVHIIPPEAWVFLPPDFFIMDIVVTPYWGLFGFMTAAIFALAVNHAMVFYHRNALEYDETDGACSGWFGEVASELRDERVMLALHCAEDTDHGATRSRAAGLVLLLAASLGLLIYGCIVDTFSFEIKGIAAWAINVSNPGGAMSKYSVFSLAREVWDQAAINDMQGWYAYLVVAYIVFAVAMPVVQICMLLVLWLAPLTLREQKITFFLNEVVAAWCAIEVFVIVLIATLMQIEKFAIFLIGDSCDYINWFMAEVLHPLGYLTKYEAKCFDVDAKLVSGCWILFAAFILSNVAYLIAWKYAHKMIMDRHRTHEERVPLCPPVNSEINAAETEQYTSEE
eukprot:gene3387-5303_t